MLAVGNLEAYASAGLPIADGLDQLFARGRRHAQALEAADLIRRGRPVASALSSLGLSSALAGIVSSGERSGTLPAALRSCRSIIERQGDLSRQCASALAYPAAVSAATGALAIGVMQGIMPQLVPLLAGLHADMPVLTRSVLALSHAISAWWPVAIGIVIVLAGASSWTYRSSGRARHLFHRSVLGIPIAGSAVERSSYASFLRCFGSMIQAGVPAIEAYPIATSAVSIEPVRGELEARYERLSRGEPFSSIAGRMPRYVRSLLASGEATGKLSESCLTAADMLDKEAGASLERLRAFAEPALMLFMGGIVGTVALSVMLPIYGISKATAHM